MKSLTLIGLFLLANLLILTFASFVLLFHLQSYAIAQVLESKKSSIITSSYSSYRALPETVPVLQTEVIAGDARAKIINNFFSKYHSPMRGLGDSIVNAADKFHLPYGLLPAIAMCEGNLGKYIPEKSYNSYGWGIYADKILRFASWHEGIETVSQGLREDYFNKGLDTPDKIMKKYTPSSNGSWSNCVEEFLQELR